MNTNYRTKQVPLGLGVGSGTPAKRVLRRPHHTWNIAHRPYLLQPCLIAPLLPGETLEKLAFKARAVSDPVKNSLIGWWLDYYFYRVPIRALGQLGGSPNTSVTSGTPAGMTTIERMLLDVSAPITDTMSAASANLYEYDASGEAGHAMVRWLQAAMDSIVAHDFTAPDADLNSGDRVKIDDCYVKPLNLKHWTDSVFAAAEFPDVTQDINATPTPDNFSVEEFHGLYQTWQLMQQQGMQELTFDDYLMTFGVRKRAADVLAPEFIGRKRQWSYPTNTVGTSGEDLGVPSAALSYSPSGDFSKKLFCKEPSLVIGFTCFEPKVYLAGQRTYGAAMLNDALSWMPAVLKENVELSIKRYLAGEGPLGGTGYRDGDDYILDVRDLYVHGDHFRNHSAAGHNLVAAPHAGDEEKNPSRFVDSTDMDSFFSAASPANKMRQDGAADLYIMGTQVDHT